MKRIALLSLLICAAASAQNRGERSLADAGYLANGFYVQAGYARGPSFSSFFDYINTTYHLTRGIDNFGGNASFSLGYISRFHRNFALDVGFSIYGMNKEFEVVDTVSALPESRIRQELNYQSAIFAGSLPVILEFSSKQPVVPYIGIGISIFSLRLDHYRGVDALRDTRTAVGGHFGGGVAVKITKKLWLDLRGRWHAGTSHLLTLEHNSGTAALDFREFEIKQNVAQFSLGFDYFFR
jgi:opacity protein-like surface antigen